MGLVHIVAHRTKVGWFFLGFVPTAKANGHYGIQITLTILALGLQLKEQVELSTKN